MPMVTPAAASTPAAKFAANAGSGIGDTLLMLLYLTVILVALYFGCRWLAKFAQRGTLFKGGSGRFKPGSHIVMLDRLMFDKDRGVILIESDAKRYLIGVGRDKMTLMDSCDAPEEAEGGESSDMPVQTSFKDALAAWKDRAKK